MGLQQGRWRLCAAVHRADQGTARARGAPLDFFEEQCTGSGLIPYPCSDGNLSRVRFPQKLVHYPWTSQRVMEPSADIRTDAEIARSAGKAVPDGGIPELQRWDAGADAMQEEELETGQANQGPTTAQERAFRATADPQPQPKVRRRPCLPVLRQLEQAE